LLHFSVKERLNLPYTKRTAFRILDQECSTDATSKNHELELRVGHDISL